MNTFLAPRAVMVWYEDHCSDPECGLGRALYDCPWCGESVTDYGAGWWHRFEPDPGFLCAHCKMPLTREM